MEPFEQRTRRAPRLLIGGLILFGLLALVSLASRSGFGHSSDAGPSADYLSWAYSAFLVLWVLAIPATLWALWMQGKNATVERPGFKQVVIQNVASVAILCALIGGALYLRAHGRWGAPHGQSATKPAKAAKGKKNAKPVAAEPTFKWPVAVALGGVLVILAFPLSRAYLHERRRRRERALRRPLSQREQIAADVELLIDDLRDEPDARRAIIAAYARMEGVFARHDLPRRESETAGEYLRRIVVSLTDRPEPVERLTSLFERAKFGQADADVAMKEQAIAALEQIRDDVEEPA
jgi:uncharacterized protein DUF4129